MCLDPMCLCGLQYATFEVYLSKGEGGEVVEKQFQEFAFLYFGLIINTPPSLSSPFPSDSVHEMGAFFPPLLCWDPRLGCQD